MESVTFNLYSLVALLFPSSKNDILIATSPTRLEGTIPCNLKRSNSTFSIFIQEGLSDKKASIFELKTVLETLKCSTNNLPAGIEEIVGSETSKDSKLSTTKAVISISSKLTPSETLILNLSSLAVEYGR